MVREYIGARYVPKFMGIYDATQSYEALCVVDNGQGTSYITKIPTPAGTPLTNTTYWTIYGASSGAIINLQNQINDMKDDTIQGSLQNQITDNSNDITQLASDTTNKFNTLFNTNIRNINKRLIVFLGDSYTQVPSAAGSFVGKVANRLGLASSQYHNIGVSGYGLEGYVLEVNGYTYNDADKVTDVVITGGINDAHNNITDISAIESKIDALYTATTLKFPNATIWVGFSGGGFYRNLVGEYPGFNYDNIRVLKYIWSERWSGKAKCVYMQNLDLWASSLSDTDYYQSGGTNGCHPLLLGIDLLAESISNYLKGYANSLNDRNPYACPIVQNSNWNVNVWNMPSSLRFIRSNGNTNIECSYGSASFNTPITFHYGVALTIASMVHDPSNEILATNFNKRISVPSYLLYKVSGGSTFEHLPIDLRVEGNAIKALPYTANPPIENVESFFFPGFNITIPTDLLL